MPKSTHLPFPYLRWRGLTLQLFAWVIFPLIAFLLLTTFGSLALHQRAMRTMVGERDARAAQTAARALSEMLDYRVSAVQALALRAADGRLSPQQVLFSSTFLLQDFDAGVAIFSPEGELLAYTGNESFWAAPTDAQKAELEKMLSGAGRESRFSAVIPSTKGTKPMVLVSAADNPNAPILIGAFYPNLVAEKILSDLFDQEGEGDICLIAAKGEVLFSTRGDAPLKNPLDHPGVREALRGESGTFYMPADGGEHVIAYSSVEASGWALILEEPWESVSTPLLNTTLFAPLIFIPILLLSLVALWFGARKIVQPLQNLEERARELAWGDFESIETSVGGIEEIDRLQNTLIYLARKVQAAQESLRDYIGAITIGQEDERRRLGRELHDETIQDLIALNQRVQLLQMNVDEGRAAEQLDEIQRMTTQTIDDLRRLIRALRPLYLDDLGLVAALEMLARETQDSAAIPLKFQHTGLEHRLSPNVELAFYRIAQEALNNIQHHANATQATLKIDYSPETITLTISDNGIGFTPPESPAEFAPGGHFGLLGIYERAELIGARLEIHSAEGEGTKTVVIYDH